MSSENLKIGARIAAGFGAILLILLAIAWLGMSRMTLLDQNQNLVRDRWKNTQQAEKSLDDSSTNMMLATRILIARDRSEIERLAREQDAHRQSITDAIHDLEKDIHSEEGQELLGVVKRTREEYVQAFIENRELAAKGDRNGAIESANRRLLPARVANLRAWNDFIRLESAQMEQAIAESSAAYASGISLLLKMAVFALFTAWLTAYLLMRSITVPLGVMAAHLEEHRKLLGVLRESQQRLRLHIEQTPLVAIEWNLNYEVTEWNPAAEKVFGYTRAEALGRHVSFIVSEALRPHVEQIFRELFTHSGGTRSTNENITREGTTVLCEWYNTPLVDQGGQVVGIASLASDITEHARLEEQYRQAQKMEAVGQLAGGIAHDFNNLLNVILGYCDIALAKMHSIDPLRGKIEHIRTSGQRAAALTRQLLAFSRKQVLDSRIVNLNDLLRAMEHLLRHVITENIEMQLQAPPNALCVKVDPAQMEQVILNLVINARDAMPEGGKLTLALSRVRLDDRFALVQFPSLRGEFILLAISDTGMGMDAATKARIFEPFFTTKGPEKGTGLGLATVYGIVKQSGGYVTVDSEPGQGSSFQVYLPCAPLGEGVPDPAPSPGKIAGERKCEEAILIVEDDAALRELLSEFLAEQGYSVLIAGTGAAAMAIAKSHKQPIHLLVTDVILPGMSGPALAQQLLALRPALLTLFVSGYPQDEIAQDGNLSPGIEFLQKPYKLSDLAERIRLILDRGRDAAQA